MYQDSIPGAINVTLDPNSAAATGAQGSSQPSTSSAVTAASSYTYPSDLKSQQIYCNILIGQYTRNRSATNATFATTGTISLPMPLNFLDSYGASIGSPNLGIFGALGQNIGAVENAATNALNTIQNNPESTAKGAIVGGLLGAIFGRGRVGAAAAGAVVGGAIGASGADKVRESIAKGLNAISDNASYNQIKSGIATSVALNPLAGDGPLAKAARVSKGIVPNPHTVSTFEGMRLKTYNLNWRFSPKSEAESRTIAAIVELIKRAMHPKSAFASFALTYPNVIRVTFSGTKDIPNIRTSFISNFQVNPYGSGQAAFFRSGYPTSYEIQLELQELETLFVGANGALTTAHSR